VKAFRLSIVSIVSIASRDGAKSAAAVGSQGVGSESAVLGQSLERDGDEQDLLSLAR
jgi:hypothetical protein